jgi:glucuronoarabinoxylan endo-1,4-beta-xylanase
LSNHRPRRQLNQPHQRSHRRRGQLIGHRQYNAYVWWWIWDDPADGVNYGLIDSNTSGPTPTYFGYAVGQFSKFVQPGYYRYNATANPSANIYVSAYAGNGNYVVVAINSGTSSVSQPFTIQNASVTSMAVWQTTAAAGLQQQSASVTISSGQFIDTLPAQSITTFVSQ